MSGISALPQTLALPNIYFGQYLDSLRFPAVGAFDHTMSDALDAYVSERIPRNAIDEVIREQGTIEIHGIYPTHFREVFEFSDVSEFAEVYFQRNKIKDKFNYIRPQYFHCVLSDGLPRLIVALTPGRDYVHHYAAMVRYHLNRSVHSSSDPVKLFRYPVAENSIARWTALNDTNIRLGDRLVLGYVDDINELLRANSSFTVTEIKNTEFYTSTRYRGPNGSHLITLGVKFSFWGSISKYLVAEACLMGVKEIIYVGKLGTLSHPKDVYSRVFIPSSHWLVDYANIIYRVNSMPLNPLAAHFPSLVSGPHVSVSTVLEEDYRQRTLATKLNACTIDNEIAHMSHAISLHNLGQSSSRVMFSTLHIATDYVRSDHERTLVTLHHLGNDKTEAVRTLKRDTVLTIVDKYLIPYLENTD